MRPALFFTMLLGVSCASAPPTSPLPRPVEFALASGFGEEAGWVSGHLAEAAAVLVRRMDAPDLPPPRRIEVTLVLDPEGEHGGWASADGIGYTGDRFPRELPYVWILTHELTNLFAAHYGGHGGFPSDWWSNGRSPFPIYLTTLVLEELGCLDVAAWLRRSYASEPDHLLYWSLEERFGFDLFARTLRELRRDDLDLGELDPPWPAPSRVRSAYTIAYLSQAAGEDLTATVTAAGIGREPGDWAASHPELPFVEYEVTEQEVAGILRARGRAFGADGSAEDRARFRAGRWREVDRGR